MLFGIYQNTFNSGFDSDQAIVIDWSSIRNCEIKIAIVEVGENKQTIVLSDGTSIDLAVLLETRCNYLLIMIDSSSHLTIDLRMLCHLSGEALP